MNMFSCRRYISNSTLFDKLVEVAHSLPDSRYPLGGNAPVMANRFVMEGCNVMLAASVSDSLKKEIASSIKGTVEPPFGGHSIGRPLALRCTSALRIQPKELLCP